MTDKEKIRAYVKKLQKPEGYGDYWKGYDSALNDILSFIDSLQEEPVDKCKGCNNVKGCITCVDGDQWAHYEEPVIKELEEASKEWLVPQLDKSYVNYGEVKMMEFTHFDGYAMLDAIEFGAKWGKNQAMAEIQAQSMALAHGCPEESENEDLEEAAEDYGIRQGAELKPFAIKYFKAGAKWQKEQDQSTIELAEDHAMLAGMEKMKEEMMSKAIVREVKVDAGGYPYIDTTELYDYDKDMPLAKERDKVKILVIKE